jgi:hypothetical protein
MKVGDLVVIRRWGDEAWGDGEHALVLEFTKRLYIPAASVLVLGEVAEFDLDELEGIDEAR